MAPIVMALCCAMTSGITPTVGAWGERPPRGSGGGQGPHLLVPQHLKTREHWLVMAAAPTCYQYVKFLRLGAGNGISGLLVDGPPPPAFCFTCLLAGGRSGADKQQHLNPQFRNTTGNNAAR